MAFKPVETFQGVVDFTNIDTTKQVQPGFCIIRGIDTASGQGGGEFMYLPGVSGGQVAGNLVTYNPLAPSAAPHAKYSTSRPAGCRSDERGWHCCQLRLVSGGRCSNDQENRCEKSVRKCRSFCRERQAA